MWSEEKAKYVAAPLGFDEALAMVISAMRGESAKLGGVAPTANPYFFNPRRLVHERAFIVGDFFVVSPCTERFDETLTLKEDYDYTLQHLSAHGRVARCNGVLATFKHRTNKGGACDVRTPELEQENIEVLKKKWGSVITDNPKRPNEILLKLKRGNK